MNDRKFYEFISEKLDIHLDDMEKIELEDLYSIDVRSLNPSWFANLIMMWCWLRSKKLRKVGWKKRWHHCIGVELWKIYWNNGDTYTFAVSYDAQEKYERNLFKELIKEYEIINISHTTKTLKINTEDKMLKVHDEHESLVGTDYGKKSIVGLVHNDITRAEVIGIDGKDQVICSEAEMWACREFILAYPNEPFDYVDVIERGLYIPMSKYNGELDRYK